MVDQDCPQRVSAFGNLFGGAMRRGLEALQQLVDSALDPPVLRSVLGGGPEPEPTQEPVLVSEMTASIGGHRFRQPPHTIGARSGNRRLGELVDKADGMPVLTVDLRLTGLQAAAPDDRGKDDVT